MHNIRFKDEDALIECWVEMEIDDHLGLVSTSSHVDFQDGFEQAMVRDHILFSRIERTLLGDMTPTASRQWHSSASLQ